MDLFPDSPARAEQRVVQILEAAIRSYASVGVEETSFQALSKRCKVSRPLIHHYFGSKRELFEGAVKYIRAHLQKHVVTAIQSEKEPREQLRAYVAAHVDWVEAHPEYAAVATLFFYYCAIDKKLRALNAKLVAMGHERITALIEEGIRRKVFPPQNAASKAKALQLLVTGLTLAAITEVVENPGERRRQMLEECEALLR